MRDKRGEKQKIVRLVPLYPAATTTIVRFARCNCVVNSLACFKFASLLASLPPSPCINRFSAGGLACLVLIPFPLPAATLPAQVVMVKIARDYGHHKIFWELSEVDTRPPESVLRQLYQVHRRLADVVFGFRF